MSMIGYFFKVQEDKLEQIRENGMYDIVFREDEEDNLLDVDKTWHAIHYIVTGTSEPEEDGDILSRMVIGGEPLNEDEDMGYGPALLIDKETVAQIAEALEAWDEAAFREHFDMQGMIENQIYPVMDDEDEEVFYEYVWGYFTALKDFYREAAEEGANILSFIS